MPASTRALYYFPFWLLSSYGVEIPGNEALVAIAVEFSACGKLQSSLKKKKRKKKEGKNIILAPGQIKRQNLLEDFNVLSNLGILFSKL